MMVFNSRYHGQKVMQVNINADFKKKKKNEVENRSWNWDNLIFVCREYSRVWPTQHRQQPKKGLTEYGYEGRDYETSKSDDEPVPENSKDSNKTRTKTELFCNSILKVSFRSIQFIALLANISSM